MKRKILDLVLFLFFLSALLINIFTLKDGHNWGDDFAQYIIYAKNLVSGQPFASGVMLDNPSVYPPGFGLILTPLVKIFGINFKIFKILNIIFWFGSIYVLYLFLKRRQDAGLVKVFMLLLAFSSYFFVYKQNVLSDLPFFFFVCSCLYSFDRAVDLQSSLRQKKVFFISFIILATIAFYVRSIGGVLFITALIYYAFIQRSWIMSGWVTGVFILNSILLYYLAGQSAGFFTSIIDNPIGFISSVLNNFSTFFRGIWSFMCPGHIYLSSVLYRWGDQLLIWLAPALYLVFLFYIIFKCVKRSVSYLELFSFLYLSMLIFWSGFSMPPDAFVRFVLPFIPFVIYFYCLVYRKAAFFANGCGKVVLRIFIIIIILVNALNIIVCFDFNDDVINRPANRIMVEWISNNTKSGDRFMFSKPRFLALLTGREGTAPWVGLSAKPEEDFYERVVTFNIDFLILFNSNDKPLRDAVIKRPDFWEIAWSNEVYTIFKRIK